MKEFIYNEMMIHVPLCTSKNPKNVLIIGGEADELKKEIQKHDDIKSKSIACEIDNIKDEADNSYDIVICQQKGDAAILAHINRILKDDGLMALSHPPLDEVKINTALMQILGNYFKIIMPYNLGNSKTALLVSKEYHPTADIILQRADMLDGLEYYNCDVHVGSFAMGNYIRKEYLGIIKN